MRFRSSYLFVLLFFSGAAGLGYEIVWTRMLSTVLGHEIIAVLALVLGITFPWLSHFQSGNGKCFARA